ncbi:ABC transporter ATP-binding protein [Metaclostridioides mangenotii]|uniref:ABC transporter ATP-binding protein n=1 Tax=Metaclostridioides mangenotii TaxID=1540 RepID=UPI0026EF9DD5|nr:ABC transporter ATP-binding protein [Clostridioides mangenotii]
MNRILKRLPVIAVTLSVIFLLLQIFCNLYLPYVIASIVDKGVIVGNISYIYKQGAFMFGITLISLVSALGNTLFSAKISYKLGNELRNDIYRKVLSFSKVEFDKFGSSSLITRNTNDVNQVQNLVEMSLKFLIMSPLYLIGGIAMTYSLSPKLSLVFVAVIPLMFIAAVIINKFASPLYMKMQKNLDHLNLIFKEGLSGVKIIRAFNKEKWEFDKYQNVNADYTKTSIKAGTIMSVFIPLITIAMNFTMIAIIWIGGHDISSGSIEVGTLIAVISYSAEILLGFMILTQVIVAIPRGLASAKRINEVLDTKLSIEEIKVFEKKINLKGDLTFENVDFHYPDSTKYTLSDISFRVKPGQTLAIVGGTGDGKSTLLNLVTRLYDVDNGNICINKKDVRSISKHELNEAISFSPQKSTLFFGTIRSNMLLAKSDATDDEIWNALDIACASEFVKNLENGLDSPVEKSGGNFSGGQKQRLCIARTILKNSEIYIFDDSFSALDFKTDAFIRKSLNTFLADKIKIIVAQRVNTIVDADIIVVLDKGKVTGIGTHKSLKKSNPVYQEILASQVYDEEVAI